jgi:HD-like signal output (HDOD) protein
MFTRRTEVESIRQAVLALGIQRVRDIVYSCSLPKLFSGAQNGMAHATFWRHALGTALVSQNLAQRLKVADIEKLYLAGLLCDIGILVNSLLYPEEFKRVLAQAEASETPLCEVEQEILGFTHCESGRVLADIWKLPPDISEAIEFHHHPIGHQEGLEMTCVVYLADLLCRLRGLGYGYYEAREFDLAAEAPWEVLKKKHPDTAAGLDMARFTIELDQYGVEVQKMVDSIFSNGSGPH